MPPALFVLYLHLLGRPPMRALALGLVRLAHLLSAASPTPALQQAAVALRSRAVDFATVNDVSIPALSRAMPVDGSTLPMVPPGLAVTALTALLDLASEHPDRVQFGTPQDRWKALVAAANVVVDQVEQLEADPGHRTTDPAPAPVASGEVPLG